MNYKRNLIENNNYCYNNQQNCKLEIDFKKK